ncbi:MAG: diguanylate cyclase [Solirubrobacterales bacterium]|nr:diguanylate cyclase [Solirubrobacterales bacterium]
MSPAAALRRRLPVLGLAVAVFTVGRLTHQQIVLDGHQPAIWFAAGVSIAALLRGGLGLWPGVPAGALANNLVGGAELPFALANAGSNTVQALLGAWLLARVAPGTRFGDLRDTLVLFVVATLVAVQNALVGGTALYAGGSIPSLSTGLPTWALGDLLGILLVLPLLLRAFDGGRRDGRRAVEAAVGIVLLVAVEVVVLQSSSPRIWLMLPLLLWLALRHSTVTAAAAGFAVAVTAIVVTRTGAGPFADGGDDDALLQLQVFTTMITGGLLTISSVVAERTSAVEDLRRLAREDAALRRVATAVAASGSLEEVSRVTGREIAGLLGVDGGVVVRFEDDRHITVLGQWLRDARQAPLEGQRVAIAPGSAVDCVRATGVPARFDERDGVPTLPPVLQRVAAPVRAGGRIWGAVVASSVSRRDLPRDAEQRLGRFAELVALAISNADARARLEAQATTDPLTGLLNHRAFHERLREEVALARRHGRALSVAVFDLDRFKEINDALGHVVGDTVLAETARRIVGAAREGEVAARIGGDELAVVLPGTDAVAAHQAAERLRAAVGAAPFPGAGELTCSAGVCDLSQAGDAEELVRLADGALYWAKEHGRDACYRYDPEIVAELSAADRAERLERSRALAAVRALARAIDAKDPATIRHSERVAELACRLAEARGWSCDRVARLRDAALVHDVGKIGLPDAILSKPGRLTDEEYAAVKRHSELGARIAGEVLDDEQVAWVRGHHERHDGGGYPDGLAGEGISEGARLLALADAWDAMTGARVYSAPMPEDQALAEVRRNVGTQFHPDAVAALEALDLGVGDVLAA